jgi:WD40 repeat protein
MTRLTATARFHLFLAVLLCLGVLVACQPADVDLLAEQIEAQVAARTPGPRLTATAVVLATNTATEPSWSPTPEPDEAPNDPYPAPLHSETTEALTLQVTSTLMISETGVISPTIVITSTNVSTTTWGFRDVRVTEGGAINQVAWVEDDRIAVAASNGLYLYQAADLSLVRATNLGETVLSLAYSPGEGLLAWGDFKGDIHWYDPESGQYQATTSGHRLGVTDLTQPMGSAYLFSGSDDGTVRTWVASFALYPSNTATAWMDLWQAPERVTSVAANSFRSLVIAGSYRRVTVWNLDTGDRVWASWDLAGWIGDVALSQDGWTLAVADSSNQLKMWSTDDWRLTHNISIQGCDQITALEFGPEDFQVAVGCKNGKVLVLNGEDNTLSDPGEIYPQAVTDVVFHPFEPTLLTSYQDGTLRVWALGAVDSGQ